MNTFTLKLFAGTLVLVSIQSLNASKQTMEELPPPILKNLNYSCMYNAELQNILTMTELNDYILQKKETILTNLQNYIQREGINQKQKKITNKFIDFFNAYTQFLESHKEKSPTLPQKHLKLFTVVREIYKNPFGQAANGSILVLLEKTLATAHISDTPWENMLKDDLTLKDLPLMLTENEYILASRYPEESENMKGSLLEYFIFTTEKPQKISIFKPKRGKKYDEKKYSKPPICSEYVVNRHYSINKSVSQPFFVYSGDNTTPAPLYIMSPDWCPIEEDWFKKISQPTKQITIKLSDLNKKNNRLFNYTLPTQIKRTFIDTNDKTKEVFYDLISVSMMSRNHDTTLASREEGTKRYWYYCDSLANKNEKQAENESAEDFIKKHLKRKVGIAKRVYKKQPEKTLSKIETNLETLTLDLQSLAQNI